MAYAAAPYVLLINPHLRGDIPECLALALLPWALASWERLWRVGARRHFLAAVLTTTAVFLSHNLTGLTAIGLVAVLSLWRWLAMGDGDRFSRATVAAVVFVLLTAFFWLPFLAERGDVQLDVAGDGHYDYRNHFVRLQDLLSSVRPVDRRATAPDVPMAAGWAPVGLAVLGGLWAWRRGKLRQVGVYLLSGGLFFWLTTAGSRVLWEAIPGLAYYQFPWRFLGPLAVVLVPPAATLAEMPTARCSGIPWWRATRQIGLGGLALVAAMTALPALSAVTWESGFGAIQAGDIIAAELEGRWRGTTSTNDFVPTTVEMIPGPQESVVKSYRRPPVDRVNRQTLPQGASVRVLPDRPWVNRFRVTSSVDFTLRLYLFEFPGWRAWVDGEPVPIEVAHPEGFITVPVPSGDHEVVVRFGSTSARNIAWALSACGVTLCIAIALAVPPPRLASATPRRDRDLDRSARSGGLRHRRCAGPDGLAQSRRRRPGRDLCVGVASRGTTACGERPACRFPRGCGASGLRSHAGPHLVRRHAGGYTLLDC